MSRVEDCLPDSLARKLVGPRLISGEILANTLSIDVKLGKSIFLFKFWFVADQNQIDQFGALSCHHNRGCFYPLT